MQGKKRFLDKEVVRFRRSERVPPHNLYRRLAEWADWTFGYQETRRLYSRRGQPSRGPVGFLKLVLVGRLENLVSDRRLVEPCALRRDILWFLGYEVHEEVPWHSTVSRTRQFLPSSGACSTTFSPSAWPGAWWPATRRPPTRANAGQRGPTRANAGQRGPTRANAKWLLRN